MRERFLERTSRAFWPRTFWPLTPEALIATARRATGFDDPGDPPYNFSLNTRIYQLVFKFGRSREMKRYRVIRAIGRKCARFWGDQSGAAGLILAAAIMTVGFTALAIFLKGQQSRHDLERAKGAVSGEARITNAILAYYLSNASHVLPCPDTALSPDGNSTGTCTAAGNYAGAIPWVTLGISKSDAVDAYGRFYTYIVSGEANGLCESITKATAFGGGKEFTGRLISSNLEAKTTDQSAGGGQKVPFVVIGHGQNGTGALGIGGAFTVAPSSSIEQANQANASASAYKTFTTVNTGPMRIGSDLSAATYFDDQVIVPSTTTLQKACGQLTPGGSVNAMLSDNFNNNTTSAANFGNMATSGTGTDGVTIGSSADGSGNKVAKFTATGAATSYLVTNSTNFDFTPTVRPVYVSSKWRAGTGEFSIGTRGRAADIVAGDDYLHTGLTFRFNQDSSNSIVILLNGVAQTINLTVSGGLSITSGRNYTLEVYDNGSAVWARITDVLIPTRYATAYAAAITSTTNYGQVFFINGGVASELDDVLIGFPMLAMETTGTTSYAAAAGNASNGVSTGRMTLEAWVRPRAFPTTDAAIVGKWDTALADSDATQGFRLRIDSGGVVNFDASVVNGGTPAVKHYAGPSLTLNEWAHIAVTFTYVDNVTDPDTETVTFFKNGDQYNTNVNTFTSASSTVPTGVNNTTTGSSPLFVVGADTTSGTPGGHSFNGDISDVRVWSTTRTAQEISDNFQARLSAVSVTGLVVNWRLDSESISSGTGLATTTAVRTPSATGTAGALTSALYIPTLAQYFRPLSTSTNFCPTETIAGAYQCDFRVASSASGASGLAYDSSGSNAAITVPANLLGIYAKVWGAGGGGFDVTTNGSDTGAGSGGYSGGFIQSINSTAISGQQLDLYIGGYGSRATSINMGGGGGAGSAIYLHSGTVAALAAGGGGGASFSNQGTCPSTWDSSCGLGGNGEGATVASTTSHAPDQSLGCGGRGGNNSLFISNPTDVPTLGTNCPDGGGDTPGGFPHRGGGGTSGGTAGGGSILSGGAGYDANTEGSGSASASAIGGGGGGGGDNGAGQGGGEAGAFRKTVNNRGYGGGGGAATAGSGVSNATGATGTYFTAADTRSGDRTTGSTSITTISPSLLTSGWQIGDAISGNGVPDCTIITRINTLTNTITISQAATSNNNGANLIVPSQSKPSSRPGLSSDYYLLPSYVTVSTGYQPPAHGGTSVSSASASSCADGGGGVIVLIW